MQETACSNALRAYTSGNVTQQNRLETGLESRSSSPNCNFQRTSSPNSKLMRTSGRKSKSAASRQWLGRAACSVRRKLSASVGTNAAGAGAAAGRAHVKVCSCMAQNIRKARLAASALGRQGQQGQRAEPQQGSGSALQGLASMVPAQKHLGRGRGRRTPAAGAATKAPGPGTGAAAPAPAPPACRLSGHPWRAPAPAEKVSGVHRHRQHGVRVHLAGAAGGRQTSQMPAARTLPRSERRGCGHLPRRSANLTVMHEPELRTSKAVPRSSWWCRRASAARRHAPAATRRGRAAGCPAPAHTRCQVQSFRCRY